MEIPRSTHDVRRRPVRLLGALGIGKPDTASERGGYRTFIGHDASGADVRPPTPTIHDAGAISCPLMQHSNTSTVVGSSGESFASGTSSFGRCVTKVG